MLCINRIDGKYYDIAKKSSTGENEIAILYSLSDGNTHSQKSICEEWLIPKTTINFITKKLLNDGYIRVNEQKGRQKMLELTDSGKEYARNKLKTMREAEEYAMEKTLEQFDASFIDALEAFADYFMEKES